MTDKDKPDIQNSGISNEAETAIQTPIFTDEETLLFSDALTVDAIDEPTRKFVAPTQKILAEHKTKFKNERTKDLQDELQNDELDESKTAPDENTLKPSWLRFTAICFLCLLAIVSSSIGIYQYTVTKVNITWERDFVLNEGRFVYSKEKSGLVSKEPFQFNDELISINNLAVEKKTDIDKIKTLLSPNENYKVLINRGNQLQEIQFTAESFSIQKKISRIIEYIIFPFIFILTGIFIFLLKPNDKLTNLLVAIFFMVIGPSGYIYAPDYPLVVVVLNNFGIIISGGLMGAMFLHFFLSFPKKARILYRHPNFEYLLYFPSLLFIVPYLLPQYLADVERIQISSAATNFLFYSTVICNLIYFFSGLIFLIINYLRSDTIAKRKIRFIVVSILLLPLFFLLLIIIMIPLVIIESVFYKQELLTNSAIEAFVTLQVLTMVLIPLTFSHAIIHHKIIPVSLVIRRGLQYLLAKNALRLLLILPVVGIIWNIAANPNRTLSEILFNNSFSFYFFIVLAIGDGVLMRSRLNEWIDKKFFREQYNQERILRELTQNVKEADSINKLSRLVSSQIQAALHPENVYLFFQTERNSDFSLGFSSVGDSAKMKLPVDSPLLRFMQNQLYSIEVPGKLTDDLPTAERQWLRQIDANLLVPMHGTDGRLAGFFSLGEKKSEIPYTGRDKELLETLAHQIALVHENLSLKEQMRRDQKIKAEVLSRFDEGNINLLKECPRCGRCYDRDVINCADDNTKLTFSLPVERTIENRYRLEKLLGKGGMGAVYEAADLRLNRIVALKILSGASFGNQDALRRFEREAQASARLNHRNIVTVFDYGTLSTEGAFLVMELVKGVSLRRVFEQRGKLDLQTVIDWFGQVLDGVEAAHKARIIHRDLKPENILFCNQEGKARLSILDFGLARFSVRDAASGASVTAPGTVMGTLGYMPPEQLRGERVDERSDLFAVGVMIYEAVQGKRPFDGNSYLEIMQAMSGEIQFDKNEPLADFFKRSLALKAENRFASANEMKNALLIQRK
jgi:eukaryotic-like serine/threonine-protein kinase